MKRAASIPVLVLAAGIAGCGSAGIQYQPSGAAAPAAHVVVLKVVDNRPPLEGGKEPHVVGLRRSAVGIKGSIKESGPDIVTNVVRAATEDALARAGVGLGAGGQGTLTAQGLAFWMDWSGYNFFSGVSYKGAVAVEYTLQDPSGRILWKGLAMAEQASATDSREAVFDPALKRLAGRATRRFQSKEFQSALP